MNEVLQILENISRGDALAAEKLLPLVYEELRNLAARLLSREGPGNTLQATALVHEAYLRLVGPVDSGKWDNQGHFFAAAATAMRRILVERARHKHRVIHGGGKKRVEMKEELIATPGPDENLMALDEALTKLASQDPVKARLVELRYFGGLSGQQAAKILDISPSTADRHWAFARAWLKREVESE